MIEMFINAEICIKFIPIKRTKEMKINVVIVTKNNPLDSSYLKRVK